MVAQRQGTISCMARIWQKNNSSGSDNGSGGEKQEAPFSANQQAWLMELIEKAGRANQQQAPKSSDVDERTDGELE